MTRGLVSVGLTLCGFLAGDPALPQAARSQEPPPTFPAQVEQVTVDVVVTDKKGEPVAGLKKEDLEVYENGVPQTIVSFDAIEVAAAPAARPAPRPKVSSNTSPERRRPG